MDAETLKSFHPEFTRYLDRAAANGVRFDWLTFDEGYVGKPKFHPASLVFSMNPWA